MLSALPRSLIDYLLIDRGIYPRAYRRFLQHHHRTVDFSLIASLHSHHFTPAREPGFTSLAGRRPEFRDAIYLPILRHVDDGR
jgi:hypothetical protein